MWSLTYETSEQKTLKYGNWYVDWIECHQFGEKYKIKLIKLLNKDIKLNEGYLYRLCLICYNTDSSSLLPWAFEHFKEHKGIVHDYEGFYQSNNLENLVAFIHEIKKQI